MAVGSLRYFCHMAWPSMLHIWTDFANVYITTSSPLYVYTGKWKTVYSSNIEGRDAVVLKKVAVDARGRELVGIAMIKSGLVADIVVICRE